MDPNRKPRQDVASEPVTIDQDGDEGPIDTGILHEPAKHRHQDEPDPKRDQEK